MFRMQMQYKVYELARDGIFNQSNAAIYLSLSIS